MQNITGFGLPWYEPEDYPAMRELLKNPANMPMSYNDWLPFFEELSNKTIKAGYIPLKIKTNVHRFSLFCVERGLKPHSDNLYAFTSFEAWRIDQAGG